jgi:hypothetical protein
LLKLTARHLKCRADSMSPHSIHVSTYEPSIYLLVYAEVEMYKNEVPRACPMLLVRGVETKKAHSQEEAV